MSGALGSFDKPRQHVVTPPLAANAIHVWHLDLRDGEGPWTDMLLGPNGILDDKEKARANRFHRARDGQDFLRCHILLRLILAGYEKCLIDNDSEVISSRQFM